MGDSELRGLWARAVGATASALTSTLLWAACGAAGAHRFSGRIRSLVGLRYRVLIGVMIYTFARIGAVLQMNVGDYFTQGRRGWGRYA